MPLDNIAVSSPGIRFPTVVGGNTDALNPDFPIVNIQQVKGGITPFDTIIQRNQYKEAGRQWGMIAYVTNDPENVNYDSRYASPCWFFLENKNTNVLLNNANWTEFSFGVKKVFRAIIGDNTSTEFVLNHDVNDISPNVVCYRINDGSLALPAITISSALSLTLSFKEPPLTNNIRVKITGDN